MFKALLLTLALTEGADCIETHVGLARPSLQETVLTQNPWINDGVMAGRAFGEQWSLRRLHARHPRWAAAITAGVVVGNSVVLVHNARLLQQYRHP